MKILRDLGRTKLLIILICLIIAVGVIVYRSNQLLQPHPPAFPADILRVAIDPSYAPFAYFDDDAQLVGIDVDLAHALGAELNLPVDLQIMGIDALYDALRDRRVDVIISAIQPESWRMGDVLYSQPYFNAGLVLISEDEAITTMDDLPGHSLAYEFGSAADAEARLWSRRVREFEERPYEIPDYALDAVRLGEADAALVDAISARLYLREHSIWQPQMNHVTDVPFVIAVRIDHINTYLEITASLEHLLEGRVMDSIISRWLD